MFSIVAASKVGMQQNKFNFVERNVVMSLKISGVEMKHRNARGRTRRFSSQENKDVWMDDGWTTGFFTVDCTVHRTSTMKNMQKEHKFHKINCK